MNRTDALSYVTVILDDALNVRAAFGPTKGTVSYDAVLVGWQCGFEPMFVVVQSYLPDVRLDADEAVEIAVDYLKEKNWFVDPEKTDPDYVIAHLTERGA
jgi:hypothetical protein